ncbi:hypothetical protein ES288_A05G327800v1 [Gossypium darwinii]|uniref:Reverse transcriptase zinc-binding domain-containing protein n=1 Tax=Gossypium darwinii TaxID=34276 RepID=A0A5D2GM90_GOSDA|nr:hypothetical protein ES288_A05G327800v1 [Gossypium darwinii]
MTKVKSMGGMGFRDLNLFNISLLAKQCWKLLQNPKALWARVLKGGYFPKGAFLNAKQGSTASWVWASLLQGVVLEKLTDDNHDLPQKVAELMTKENNCWKLNQIRRYISEDQVKAIQSLPAYSRGQDKMVLTGSKDGNYVVKKGCHELKEKVMKEVERRASPSHNVNGKVWKWIWSISLPQKIKHFLWRAVGNLVATNGNLVKRRIKMSELCPVCLKEAETVEHTLLLCDWAQCVWYGGALGFKVDCHRITTLDQWLLQKGNFVDFDFKKVGKEANKAADWCAHLAGDVLLVNPHPHW